MEHTAAALSYHTVNSTVPGQMLVSHRQGVIVTSSSQFYITEMWDVSKAVDGNADTSAILCKCCGLTNSELNPWYKVDLIQEYRIQRIHVLGRTDWDRTCVVYYELDGTVGNADDCSCCGATLNVSILQMNDCPFSTTSGFLYKMEIQLGITESGGTVLQGVHTNDRRIQELDHTLTSPELVRFITLTLRNITITFTICELYVYAVCNEGTYGPDCVNTCGNCRNNESCDGVTGTCSECVDGHQSPLCQDCIDRRYGPTCEECGKCYGNVVCESNGNCPNGCSAGYKGTTCKEVCSWGTYGLGCANTCGKCENNSSCNIVDGACTGCVTGYRSLMCKECQSGIFGFNCEHHCGMCLDGDVCDIYTGACPNGCTDGYNGLQCFEKITQDTSSNAGISVSLTVFIASLFAVSVVNATIIITLVVLLYRKRLHTKTSKAANSEDPSIQLPTQASHYDTLDFDNPDGVSTYAELNRRS